LHIEHKLEEDSVTVWERYAKCFNQNQQKINKSTAPTSELSADKVGCYWFEKFNFYKVD
jgi:hypothetical protein